MAPDDPEVDVPEVVNGALDETQENAKSETEPNEVQDVDADSAVGDADEGQGEEGQVAGAPAKKGNPEYGRMRAERREAQERADRLEREVQELRVAQQRLSAAPSETPDQRAARQALMTPEERMSETLNDTVSRMQASQNELAFRMQEQADQSAFSTLKGTDPIAAKYADEVERRLAGLRAQGQNYSREIILNLVAGEKMRAGRATAVPKAKAAAAKRVDAQRVPAGNGRGDTGANRREKDDRAAARQRAETYTF